MNGFFIERDLAITRKTATFANANKKFNLNPNNMKVALYLRVSTLHQDYERQRAELIDFCKYRGFEIVKVFEEKASGMKDDRAEFQALCHLTKEDVDAVVVWEISRLGRKMTTMIKTIEDFTAKGISVITKKEGFETLDADGKENPMTKIVMAVCATMAEIERESIVERTISGKINALKEEQISYTQKAPFGYKLEDKKLVINEEEAEVVKRLFNDYNNGASMMQLSKAYGIYPETIGRMMKNTVYMGKHYSPLLEKEITVPAIVTAEDWYKCEEIRHSRRKTRIKIGSVTKPLRGIMTCGCCGHKMVNHGTLWACKNQHISVNESILNQVTEKLTEMVRSERKNSEDIKVLKERKKSVRNSLKTAIMEYSSLVSLYKDAETKFNILRQTFTEEFLSKEAAELKSLSKKMAMKNLEVIELGKQEERLKKAIEDDSSNVDWVDVVENILIEKEDRTKTTITINTKVGDTYRAINYSYKRILTVDKI